MNDRIAVDSSLPAAAIATIESVQSVRHWRDITGPRQLNRENDQVTRCGILAMCRDFVTRLTDRGYTKGINA